MIPAPLMTLPMVTQRRFQPKPASVTVGGCSASSAIPSSVILATECEATGYKGVEAPEDRDAFGGVVGHPRRGPDRQTNQPVAEHRAGHEFDRGSVHLGGGDIDDQWALTGQGEPAAAGDEDRREHDATGEVAGPRAQPASGEVAQARSAAQPTEGHEHRVAGEEVRAGEDDKGQSDAKRGAHDNRPDARIDIRPDAENEDDAEPDIIELIQNPS